MKHDIADATGLYQVVIANPWFSTLHSTLLERVLGQLEQRDNPTLLILGIGPFASPYADHAATVLERIGRRARIIALDYNPKVISQAAAHLRTTALGGERGYSVRVERTQPEPGLDEMVRLVSQASVIDPATIEAGIHIREANLYHGIPLRQGSADCIDATLTLHHVIPYRQQLEAIAHELYRALKPGGMLHYGDMFLDMGGPEQTIHTIMNLITLLQQQDHRLLDDRDPGHRVSAYYRAQQTHRSVPLLGREYTAEGSAVPTVEVTATATLRIPILTRAEDYLDALAGAGYSAARASPRHIEMPLVDQARDIGHVRQVDAWFDAVAAIKRGMTDVFSHELIEASIARGDLERANARRGLYEYWRPLAEVKRALRQAGFMRIEFIRSDRQQPAPSAVGSIIAYKP